MKNDRLIELLDQNIEAYINNIAIELEKSHNQWFENFGFPMFGETSKQYHEQVYFQSYLESYTRRLINCILKDLFDEEVCDKITWPEFEYPGIYRGYTNAECEDEFGFEFINCDTKVGYRYTFFHDDAIEELLTRGKVDGITLVLWENKDELIGFRYSDKRARVILLWDLFHEMFVDLEENEISSMYGLFTKRTKEAVEQARSLISLTTLPGFTPSYLYKMRNETIAGLKKEVKHLSRFTVNDSKFKDIENNSKKLINDYNLSQLFLACKYENAFVGTSDFAKSYLTSEYLYHYFKGNPMFDYTPIVSGYLKSIEQLLNLVYGSYLISHKISLDVANYTLGDYIHAIQMDQVFRKTFRKGLRNARPTIVGCLNSYRAESRNNLFHKDYFNSWDRVERIRANTIFLYAVILGAVKPEIIASNSTALGMLSTEYDQLFCELDRQKECYYSFVIDGKEYSDYRKEPRRKGLMFNEDGLITNAVVFRKIDYDQYKTIEITRSHMPTEMWITDSFENKTNKIWPHP